MSFQDLGRTYKTTWAGSPAHMLRPDVPVWHKWRRAHLDDWDSCLYDVRLTLNEIPANVLEENMRRMWFANISKRIDAVCIRDDIIWILEVTSTAGLRAIGQAVTYRHLWQHIRPMTQPTKTGILCTRMDNDIRAVCKLYDIMIIIQE